MTPATRDANGEPLLEIQGLRTWIETERGVARVVDGVDLVLRAGETLGLVGESGSGKSMTALSILALVTRPARIVAGRVLFRGRDLLALPPRELAAVRGNEIAMVFQEPGTALNPVFTAGEQIAEVLRAHRGLSRQAARGRAVELLASVGIPSPAERSRAYPHQLSGGTRQRVMIAMAMACGPALLIADEPTSALDVTVQAEILELLAALRERSGMALFLISHDLALVSGEADRIAVMYAGRIVEEGPVEAVFERPGHPYTIGLLRSRPDAARAGERVPAIAGSVPSAFDYPSGCRFRTRCPLARARCAEEDPALRPALEAGSGADPAAEQRVACHFLEEARAL